MSVDRPETQPLDHARVPVAEFQAADPDVQDELVPHRPGLYIWTHNISRLLRADVPTVDRALSEALKVVGRRQTKYVKPYYSVTVQDERYRIHDKKRVRLHALINEANPLGDWVALLASEVQRPLYVGMALDLRKRLHNHLTGNGSDLRRRLRDAHPMPVDMLDLCFSWWAAPIDPPVAPVPPDTASDTDSESPTSQDPEDAPPSETVEGEPDSDDPQFGVGSEIDLTLKAAESLLIRLAMPMFNEKQD